MDENIKIASKSFENLLVWQKAHTCVLDVYRTTKEFPKEKELYGLTSQFQNAARNIQGSLSMYYMILSKDLGYIK